MRACMDTSVMLLGSTVQYILVYVSVGVQGGGTTDRYCIYVV
jgi:hypothetical protein